MCSINAGEAVAADEPIAPNARAARQRMLMSLFDSAVMSAGTAALAAGPSRANRRPRQQRPDR